MDWLYDAWPSGEPYDWGGTARGEHPDDNIDFHVDLGCGTVKKGRIGVDRYPAPGVNILADLNKLWTYGWGPNVADDAPAYLLETGEVADLGLPFPNDSIQSIISHHAFEHIGEGFMPLMDEVYRVLKPGGILRAITPLFPSTAAVEDPDHCRYFMEGTWEAFCGWPDVPMWCESFSVPYTKARFELTAKDTTALMPPEKRWTPEDRREIRVTLKAQK